MEKDRAVDKKQLIAIGIALQTQVLRTCPVHRQLYFDDEANPASAFALAVDLVRNHKPYVDEFHNDAHELTDLLSDTLATTPIGCPECQPSARLSSPPDRSGLGERALERGQIVGFGQHQNGAQSLAQQQLDVEGAIA
jgi:hypothetical protein